MNGKESTLTTKMKVGIFSLLGILIIGAITVFVNDKPFWWRPCQLVEINVEDATGLRAKSPVRSLGLQIGYISTVTLSATHVKLGICITAPVEMMETTKAYIRPEGFLGDKFVELKPVKYTGEGNQPAAIEPKNAPVFALLNLVIPSSHAQVTAPKRTQTVPMGDKSQDVGELVNQVNDLVGDLNLLTKDLRQSLDPEDVRRTMRQLNLTLESASKTLSPEGGLTTTAQRSLGKLESAIEQLQDIMTRINQGKGSVGKLINDEQYAEEILEAIRNVNRLLSKVGGMRFILDLGSEYVPAYERTRSWFQMAIWPRRDRYYLVGLSIDPRGSIRRRNITTTVNGTSQTVQVLEQEAGGILLTGMIGKVLWNRIDLAVGFLHGDGAGVANFYLGSTNYEDRIQVRLAAYGNDRRIDEVVQLDARAQIRIYPSLSPYLKSFYVQGGLDSMRQVDGQLAYTVGGGISFDDNDIKILFSFL